MGGTDKGLLTLGGDSLLDHVVARLAPQCGPMAINANGDPARFGRFGLPVLQDSVTGFPGPLAGVLAGLDWAAGLGAEAIVTAAADTPFLPTSLVSRLEAARDITHPIALAASEDAEGRLQRHPTFGIWPVALREDLRAELLAGLRKIVLWTRKHGMAEVPFDHRPFDPFFNINTPEDLARAEDLLDQNRGT